MRTCQTLTCWSGRITYHIVSSLTGKMRSGWKGEFCGALSPSVSLHPHRGITLTDGSFFLSTLSVLPSCPHSPPVCACDCCSRPSAPTDRRSRCSLAPPHRLAGARGRSRRRRAVSERTDEWMDGRGRPPRLVLSAELLWA